jgi:hypothetical protein
LLSALSFRPQLNCYGPRRTIDAVAQLFGAACHKSDGSPVFFCATRFAGFAPTSIYTEAMNLYSTVVFLHVITAILGLGSLPILAVTVGRATPLLLPWDRVAQILVWVGCSLAGMFVTGAIIIAFTHGALEETGWMRTSFVLFLLLGALHGLARRQLRRIRTETASPPATKPLSGILWTMCGVITAITYLMEAKPW